MEIKINLKIFVFIAIFLLTGQIEIYGILMFFALLHEIGHLVAGILLKFKPQSLKIFPLGLCISFSTFPKDYNYKVMNGNLLKIKEMIIAISGPLTNLIIICCSLLFLKGILLEKIIYANILIVIFNMLPIYPLDGGRIVYNILYLFLGHRKSLLYTNYISNAVTIGMTMLASITIYHYHNIAILFIVGYLWFLVIQENKRVHYKMNIYKTIDKK